MKILTTLIIIMLCFQFLYPQGNGLTKRNVLIDMETDDPVYKTSADMKVIINDSGKFVAYIVDNFGQRILVYEIGEKLHFLKQIGQHGLGPGDLNLPSSISFWGSMFAVRDELGYSIFTTEGKFLEKVRILAAMPSFAYSDDWLYCTDIHLDSQSLINVFSLKGEKKLGIGKKHLNTDKTKSYFLREGRQKRVIGHYFYNNIILADHKTIYYIDKKFGRIFIFDKQGEELLNKEISEIFGKEGKTVLERNQAILEGKLPIHKKNSNMIKLFPLIESARLVDQHIYLFCDENFQYKKVIDTKRDQYVMRIRVLDKDTFKLVKTYEISIDRNKERILSMDVVEKDGKPVFFSAMRDDENDNYIGEFR